MSEENLKVAVRVRPFNEREIQRNAKLIINMVDENTIEITDSKKIQNKRSFKFDYSYWSHDGYIENSTGYFEPDTQHENGVKFADQKRVFDDLGAGVLQNAWEGYNATLLAYGQTGSGKSYSVVGFDANKGIIPLFCDSLFQQIEEKKAEGVETQFEVTFSMLEIDNEVVRDLLKPAASKSQGLKVRESHKGGFYAEGLTEVPVGSYKGIKSKMAEGYRNRTMVATNMNETSSRAHTIVAIKFIQRYRNADGVDTTKSSIVNLVDLAGSEQVKSTGATGERLKEGAAINQSLSSLGKAISALDEKSRSKNTVWIGIRDSVLTKLLKTALGGNSKAIMIAALSPADINYDETLSTLRFAHLAKQVKTIAKVNESPTEKLIRELREENDQLKKLLAEGGAAAVAAEMARRESVTDEDDEISEEELAKFKLEWANDYEVKLAENERQMKEMERTFEERMAKAREQEERKKQAELDQKLQVVPHLSNLNIDPQLSRKIIYFLDQSEMLIGNLDECQIQLSCASIQPEHAKISRITANEVAYTIEKVPEIGKMLLNGAECTGMAILHHNDRIWLGNAQLFLFINPQQRDLARPKWRPKERRLGMLPGDGSNLITFETAEAEMLKKSGIGDCWCSNHRWIAAGAAIAIANHDSAIQHGRANNHDHSSPLVQQSRSQITQPSNMVVPNITIAPPVSETREWKDDLLSCTYCDGWKGVACLFYCLAAPIPGTLTLLAGYIFEADNHVFDIYKKTKCVWSCCLLGCCCLSMIPGLNSTCLTHSRKLYRKQHNIKGNWCDDCLSSAFCPFCVINQVSTDSDPTSNNAGSDEQ